MPPDKHAKIEFSMLEKTPSGCAPSRRQAMPKFEGQKTQRIEEVIANLSRDLDALQVAIAELARGHSPCDLPKAAVMPITMGREMQQIHSVIANLSGDLTALEAAVTELARDWRRAPPAERCISVSSERRFRPQNTQDQLARYGIKFHQRKKDVRRQPSQRSGGIEVLRDGHKAGLPLVQHRHDPAPNPAVSGSAGPPCIYHQTVHLPGPDCMAALVIAAQCRMDPFPRVTADSPDELVDGQRPANRQGDAATGTKPRWGRQSRSGGRRQQR